MITNCATTPTSTIPKALGNGNSCYKYYDLIYFLLTGIGAFRVFGHF